MANFNTALQKTLFNEGTYVNHPSDPGGETYKGISRGYNPDWSGWAKVDEYKQSDEFPSVLEVDRGLQQEVSAFYQDRYWNGISGDDISAQDVAEELFDTAVHMGVGRAIKYLQTALNVFNRRGTLWTDLIIDSSMGPKTLAALKSYFDVEGSGFLLKAMHIQRGAHYLDRALKHELSEDFIRGWFRRLRV